MCNAVALPSISTSFKLLSNNDFRHVPILRWKIVAWRTYRVFIHTNSVDAMPKTPICGDLKLKCSLVCFSHILDIGERNGPATGPAANFQFMFIEIYSISFTIALSIVAVIAFVVGKLITHLTPIDNVDTLRHRFQIGISNSKIATQNINVLIIRNEWAVIIFCFHFIVLSVFSPWSL